LPINYGTNEPSVTKQLYQELGQHCNKAWNRQKRDKDVWVAMLFRPILTKCVWKLGSNWKDGNANVCIIINTCRCDDEVFNFLNASVSCFHGIKNAPTEVKLASIRWRC